MNTQTIQLARKNAERAVGDMADGPLKVKAFEVILARLLEEASASVPGSPLPPPTQPRPSPKTKVGARRPLPVPTSCPARILLMRDEGVFEAPRSLSEIRDELSGRGWVYPLTSLSGAVQKLVQRRELRRALVPDGKKKTYRYVIR